MSILLIGTGQFNQNASNIGRSQYGVFNNNSKNYGLIPLSAEFYGTSKNLGTVGDVLPYDAATIVEENSGKWIKSSDYITFNQDLLNSALSALTGGGGSFFGDGTLGTTAYTYVTANSAKISDLIYKNPITYSFVQDNSATILSVDNYVTTTSAAFSASVAVNTFVITQSADLVRMNDARLSDTRNPKPHTHDASDIISGVLDTGRIPILPSNRQYLVSRFLTPPEVWIGFPDEFTPLEIQQGVVLGTIEDGKRWIYKGSGDIRRPEGYFELGSITPDWTAIANKPASFPVDQHTQPISSIIGLESALNGKQPVGNYALYSDPRLTLVDTNSAAWMFSSLYGTTAYTFLTATSGHIIYDTDARLTNSRNPLPHTQDYTTIDGLPAYIDSTVLSANTRGEFAYSFIQSNSGQFVYTNDGRLSDSRNPLFHTHLLSDVTGLTGELATLSATKADEFLFEELSTFVADNSASWSGGGVVYNLYHNNGGSIIFSNDIGYLHGIQAFNYVSGASATFVTASALTAKADKSQLSAFALSADQRIINGNSSYNTVNSNSAIWSNRASTINYTIDGGGNVITQGSKGYVRVPKTFTVSEWNITADILTTTFIVDVLKASYTDMPTTSSITNGDYPTLTSSFKNRNLTANWQTINAGDFLEFYVTSNTNASIVNISLVGTYTT